MKKRIFVLALTLVMMLSAVPFASAASFTFTDVALSHKHRGAIEFCVDNGFVNGYTATSFVPDGTITREQFAVIWARTIHVRMHKFSDVQRISDELSNAIIVMQALGHINGVSDTLFSRSGNLTREQALAIAYRAYLPGVDGDNLEENFTDHTSISSWAKNPVGACAKKGLLDGVFTGNELKPSQAITRGEVCQLIYNIMKEQYNITIADMTGGTVTSDKAKAYPGETVTVEVHASPNMQLVDGSLKYNGNPITNDAFTMPVGDVVITAEFEPVDPLVKIEVTTIPTKITYTWGEPLVLTGMEVTAYYEEGSSAVIDPGDLDISPADGTRLYSIGVVNVTISYEENGITKTTIQPISVSAATPSSP